MIPKSMTNVWGTRFADDVLADFSADPAFTFIMLLRLPRRLDQTHGRRTESLLCPRPPRWSRRLRCCGSRASRVNRDRPGARGPPVWADRVRGFGHLWCRRRHVSDAYVGWANRVK